MPATPPMPNDVSTLQALVIAQQERLAARDAEIEHIKLIIAKLRRMQFGKSSEQLDATIGQLELSLEELEAIRAERTEPENEAPATSDTPAKRPVRKPLPDHLPRENVEHVPSKCACPDCGGTLKKLGEDVSEVLEYRRDAVWPGRHGPDRSLPTWRHGCRRHYLDSRRSRRWLRRFVMR